MASAPPSEPPEEGPGASDPPSLEHLEKQTSHSSLSGYLASEELSSSSCEKNIDEPLQPAKGCLPAKQKRRRKKLSFLRRRSGAYENHESLQGAPKKQFLRCRINKILGCRLCKRALTSAEESGYNNQSSCSSKNSSASHVQFSDHVIVHIYKGDSHPEMEERCHVIKDLTVPPPASVKTSLIKYLLDEGIVSPELQRESLGELLKKVAAENPSLVHHFSAPDLLDRTFFLRAPGSSSIRTNGPSKICEVPPRSRAPGVPETESEEIILDVNKRDQPRFVPTLKGLASVDKMSESFCQLLQLIPESGVSAGMFNGPSVPPDSAGPSQGQERTSFSDSNIPQVGKLLAEDKLNFPTKECEVGDMSAKVARSTNVHRDPGRLCVLNEEPCMLTPPPSSATCGEICSASDTRAVLRPKERRTPVRATPPDDDDEEEDHNRVRKSFTTSWIKPRDRQR